MAKTILIVDDSISMRQVVHMTLKHEGYEVMEGRDGEDALRQLDGRKIHLIISDVNMPNMNGIDFVRAVRAHPDYKFTPIIMLTTETALEKRQEGQAAGARAWVLKPFKPEVLVGAVKKLVLP